MNTELLLKVRDAILAEPLKFDMQMWKLSDSDSPCGTAACIAGHAVAIGNELVKLSELPEDDFYNPVEDEAIRLLQISEHQGDVLFFASKWPIGLSEEYDDAATMRHRKSMAEIASRRIDHFIATGGDE